MIRIALDAMGGDNAPKEIINGAILARSTFGVDITLIGNEQIITQELAFLKSPFKFPVVHTRDVISFSDHPSEVLRTKKDATIFVATRLVKEGRCDAVISAGSTGAQLAGAIFILGRIKGIDRPGISAPVPKLSGGVAMMCDSGAVADCKPLNLLQFAQMGSAYVQNVLGVDNPRVALVNIGEEAEKGNEIIQASYKLLNKSGLNFIGNIEAKDILHNLADVLVVDGFTGNVILKTIEGVGTDVINLVKKAIISSFFSKMGGLFMKSALRNIKKLMDYSEYGGAPLLGVDGVSIVSHGRSNAKAIASAIALAIKCCEKNLVSKITSDI